MQPPPGSVAPDELEVSHACNHLWYCLLRKNVLADHASGALALWEDGLGILACQDLARSIHRVASKKQTF